MTIILKPIDWIYLFFLFQKQKPSLHLDRVEEIKPLYGQMGCEGNRYQNLLRLAIFSRGYVRPERVGREFHRK